MRTATARSESLREGGAVALTVAVPFTRAWAVTPFFDALEASGVPVGTAALLCYVDSDDAALADAVRVRALAGAWRSVWLHVSGWHPPGEYKNATGRRKRHCAMRLGMRGLLPKTGALLMTEDDAIWPVGGYALLDATYSAGGCDFASGWQVNRWGNVRPPGVWLIEEGPPRRMAAMLPGSADVEYADAVGLYAMRTTCEAYRSLDFRMWDNTLGQDVSVTYEATRRGMKSAVDWRVGLGHLTERTTIPPRAAAPFEREADMRTIMTPSGPFWVFDEKKEREDVDRNGRYRTKQRIVDPVTGAIVVGKGVDIKLEEAVEYARRGMLSDPVVNVHIRSASVPAGLETKPVTDVETQPLPAHERPALALLDDVETQDVAVETPEDGPPYVCRTCGKPYKTRKGRDAHEAAKHGSERGR